MDEHLILDNFVQHYVFSLKQDVAQDETRIEELHKKRNFLACYCKLVVYNIIPTMRAASIFKYYVKVSEHEKISESSMFIHYLSIFSATTTMET